jgi:hypothetical protein
MFLKGLLNEDDLPVKLRRYYLKQSLTNVLPLLVMFTLIIVVTWSLESDEASWLGPDIVHSMCIGCNETLYAQHSQSNITINIVISESYGEKHMHT